MKAKDNVLRFTQNLLSVSRDREVAAADSNTSITERDNGNNNNRKRARVEERVTEENSKSGGEGKKVTIHPPIIEEKEEDHRKIEENLLCLSYAMYDTLLRAEILTPNPFVTF